MVPQFSVVTPSHNQQHLLETYTSLRNQTETDWEWVILLNGDLTSEKLSPVIASDQRVKVFDCSDYMFLGGYRRRAMTMAKGEILVELDHDDYLLPDCLHELKKYAAVFQGGFYYSDFMALTPSGKSQTFPPEQGWQSYSMPLPELSDQELFASRAFPPHPTSLVDVQFAPIHVRAWHRDCYFETGGHDATLNAADDLDLLCRTYLTGRPFVHIPKCLYVYRRHPQNHCQTEAYREALADKIPNICETYLDRVIHEWCLKQPERRVNIGRTRFEDAMYDNVDINSLQTLGDVSLPFKESSISMVRVLDGFQYLPRQNLVKLMNEIYRVLIPGGWLYGALPSADGSAAHADPCAINYMNEASFLFVTDLRIAKVTPESQAKFYPVRLMTEAPSDWHHSRNLVYTHFALCALKGQRIAGRRFI